MNSSSEATSRQLRTETGNDKTLDVVFSGTCCGFATFMQQFSVINVFESCVFMSCVNVV